MSRLLVRPRLWRHLKNLNATVMTLYLWHMVTAIVIAVAFYPTGRSDAAACYRDGAVVGTAARLALGEIGTEGGVYMAGCGKEATSWRAGC